VCLWLIGHSRFLAIRSELTPPWLMDVRHIRNAGGKFYYNKFYPFESEVLFAPNKVCSGEQFQFQPKAAVGRFLGYIVNSGCLWSGAYIVARMEEFASMNYHTGHRTEDNKFIRTQIAREVFRPGEIKEGNFRFPFNMEYDVAFNNPEGWVDS
jgi:uncharacterized membrane protein